MRKRYGWRALLCLLVLVVSPAWASSDEDAVKNVVTAQAKALTDFPKSRDSQSVLKYYAPGYSSIEDGEEQDADETEKLLLDLEEEINLGNPVGISDRVSNITPHVSGAMAWATFDEEVKIGTMGNLIMSAQGKCTAIFTKKGPQWLILHEHCSTPTAEDDGDADAPTTY